jgi:hypothetical protein
MPFDVIPDLGQVSENSAKSPSKQSCDVFHDDVSGSYFANNSIELPPQTAALTVESGPLPRQADVLTWEPAADDICASSLPPKSPNVSMNRHSWEVLRQYLLAVRVYLDKLHGLETASHPQAQ